MPSSLHVSLPDEMRAYVDLRTNGKNTYTTPSEYVRALIRNDMERESERLDIFSELLKSADDIKRGRTYSAQEVETMSKALLDELEKEERSSEEEASRMIEDVWTDPVMTFIEKQAMVTMNQILAAIPAEIGRREVAARRIGKILRAAGWTKKQVWTYGKNKKMWCNPGKELINNSTTKIGRDKQGRK